MLYKISVAASVVVLLAAGLLQRAWTDYWHTAPALAAAAERIERAPLAVGPWRGQALEMDAADRAAGGYKGCLWRRYEDSSSGNVISMLLICGRPGLVSVHTPDACYGGVGYERIANRVKVTVAPPAPVQPAVFWQADFGKPGQASAKQLRIYWSWLADAHWQAVENPRLTFMNLPVLYKLYVVCETTAGDEAKKTEACMHFMKYMLPELQKIVASPPSPTKARTDAAPG